MARLEDIPAGEREMLKKLPCPEFAETPFVPLDKPLSECRISLLSTAAIQQRDDKLFWRGAVDYRVIPGDVDPNDVVMSHSSVNFDRSGFQQDLNICFPLARLHELAADGAIGSVGAFHYSVIGGSEPEALEASAREIARMLTQDKVDVLFLVPI
ncbi:MAG: selenoprotein B glycine/betaine/sarcosine/D-proline reductase [Rhodospirillaceae bacterium]|nr:selenoprotein B glycine/betaine/sarcosine/D-proline reductase [Rhodospirillaceae bacterium]HAA93447.1 selenoprotein B glycine/betaine/sarcosine/D-proline reductase [Rhodospirillaceae bacterium]